MKANTTVWKSYLFVRRNRFLKKKKIYKKAFDLMFDKVIAIYTMVLCGYMIAGLFIFGDFLEMFHGYFFSIEQNATIGFWLILSALPIRYVIKSFREPGMVFSSSEYQLTLLPISREKIWSLAILEKLLKQLALYTVTLIILLTISRLSFSFIISCIMLFVLYDIFMVIPQWKLFQQRFLIKTGCLLLILIINGIGLYIGSPLSGILLFGIIIVINFILIRTVFQKVNWGKVTETGDYNIWNMWLIGQVSQTKFKRQKKYSVMQHTKKRKKPFNADKAVYNRLWKIYFGKQSPLLFQFTGTFLLMLVVLLFINNDSLFHLGIAVTIYSYSDIAASFFSDRFRDDIVQVLPWDVPEYKKAYIRWVLAGGLILSVPLIIYYSINQNEWLLLLLLLHCSTFFYNFQIKLNKEIRLLTKQSALNTTDGLYGLIFILLVVFSGTYPFLSLASLFIIYRTKRNMWLFR
ncbi:hypothetical protein [Oceanobacillus damuensis]|uniref:hypothetical protein n=1 Tax=Oceanobacillus damuensis TaxID=937928 RepID=UPI0008311E75|nr:hypothetical protein [Oceanobacillus damuensis]